LNDADRLIATESPRLRRYAWALTGDRAAADDLVQDCLERAWSRLHLWRRGSNLRAWLFTILHNIYVNDVRRRMRRPVVVPLTDAAVPPAVPPTQDHGIEVANVAAALSRLPEDQRAALLLVGLEELSYREAAAALGIPAGTLMSRLHRGRERLRGLLMSGAGDETLKRVK
jgi:RNA polymerase sigma-70 factor (ECF subfamily)